MVSKNDENKINITQMFVLIKKKSGQQDEINILFSC